MKKIDGVKIIEDLRKIADKAEAKNPGYKEKMRKQLFSQDESMFKHLDDYVDCVDIEVNEVSKE